MEPDALLDPAADAAQARLAAIVTSFQHAVVGIAPDRTVTDWNPAAERLYGVPAAQAIGRPIREFVAAEHRAEHAAAMTRALAGEAQSYETRRGPASALVDVSVTLHPVFGRAGAVIGVAGVVEDLTSRHARERRAQILAAAGQAMTETLDFGQLARRIARLLVPAVGDMCVIDAHTEDRRVDRIAATHVDPAKARIMALIAERYEVGRPDRRPMFTGVVEGGRARLIRDVAPSMRTAATQDPAHDRLMSAIGVSSMILAPLPGADGPLGGLILATSEGDRRLDEDDLELVSELAGRAGQALANARLYERAERARSDAEAAQRALQAAHERFRLAFEHSPTGITVVSLGTDRGAILEANPALSDMVAREAGSIPGTPLGELVHPDDRELVDGELARLAGGDAVLGLDARLRGAGAATVWTHITAASVRDEDGRPLFAVGQVQDITDRHRHEDQLRHLADHDPTTGLPNRRRLAEELDRTVARARRYAERAALLIVDLDNFKYVNDTYGHAVGDEMLRRVASAMRDQIRDTDVLARLGGDEFAVILPRAGEDEASRAAEKLRRAVAAATVAVGARELAATASIGIRAIEPPVSVTSAELLAEADIAMYDAKESGRDRVSVVGRGSAHPQRVRARLAWSHRISDALRADGLRLWEQPIVNVASGAVERTEILVRMTGEDGEPIAPGSFLPIAEQFGQVQAIDRWVIDRAVELLAARAAAGVDAEVEVNVSGASITDERVMRHITRVVEEAPIDPTRLTFEITETAAITDIERARAFARRLGTLGCQLALDDFGSGFGSFYYLKHLPFDCVKIDGEFIARLPESRADQLTVQAIVQIAQGLGKRTVAEFVQDERTVGLLGDLGVDFAQGYHLGVPRPVTLQGPYAAVT